MSLEEQRKQMKQKFANIRWNHHPCGAGSLYENTEKTRSLLERLVEKYNIKTVSDAGAGDLSWITTTKWNVDYTPYDIRKWHPAVTEFDITKQVLPKTDLIICRHVLNHLDPELSNEALDRFNESGSKYLFITCTKTHYLEERWGNPLEIESETFKQGGRTWNYALFQMQEDT